MGTPVILVCVHDIEDNFTVTHSHLYSLFSTYGNILRILIFERSNTLKAFIEFDNADSALEARKNMNRVKLFNEKYRISIYPSNLQVIKFQNNFPGGVDYTLTSPPYCYSEQGGSMHAYQQPLFSSSPDRYFKGFMNPKNPASVKRKSQEGGSSKSSSFYSNRCSASDVEEFDDEILQMINSHQKEAKACENEARELISDKEDNEVEDYSCFESSYFNPFTFNSSPLNTNMTFGDASTCKRRLPCFPKSRTEVPMSYEHLPLSKVSRKSPYSDAPLSRFYSMEEIPNSLDSQRERVLVSQSLINVENSPAAVEQANGVKTLTNKLQATPEKLPAESEKENEEKKSTVLHVLGIESKEVTTRMLYNVFSTFGNILKLLFIKTRAVALVEYAEVPSATLAKDSLNNLPLMGKPLRITFSKYPTIQLQPGQAEKYPEQLIVGDRSTFRWKEGEKGVFATPSCVLQISNIKKETCMDKKTISNCLSAYGEVKSIHSLVGDDGKNVCLVRMKSVEDCLNALGHLHDTEFGGKKIQISFSRLQI